MRAIREWETEAPTASGQFETGPMKGDGDALTNGGFFQPAAAREACELLARHGDRAKILAGGTDLMVAVNRREQPLDVVIHLGRTSLDYIRPAEDSLVIGATTTHAQIARSSTVREKAQLLAEAVRSIGSPAIRNMGTIGGNIANASPGADGAVALLALGAKVKLVSVRGERAVDLERFFAGYGETIMQADELLQEVIIPARRGICRWRWRKVGQRKAGVCAVISVAVALQLEGGVCTHAGIALGTAAPTPTLARRAGEILEGQRLDAPIIEEAARTATEALSDRDGARATAWYRNRLCETLVKRFLTELSEEEGR